MFLFFWGVILPEARKREDLGGLEPKNNFLGLKKFFCFYWFCLFFFFWGLAASEKSLCDSRKFFSVID